MLLLFLESTFIDQNNPKRQTASPQMGLTETGPKVGDVENSRAYGVPQWLGGGNWRHLRVSGLLGEVQFRWSPTGGNAVCRFGLI